MGLLQTYVMDTFMNKQTKALKMAATLRAIGGYFDEAALKQISLQEVAECIESLAQSEKNTLYLPVKIDKHGFIFNMQSLFDAGIEGKFKIKLEVCDE